MAKKGQRGAAEKRGIDLKKTGVKEFISPDKVLLDSFILAKKIWDSGFRPTYLLSLWRGGTPIGVCVHEYLTKKGIQMKHLAIKAESYEIIANGKSGEVVQIGPLNVKIAAGEQLLIIDDVFDSGATTERLLAVLRGKTEHSHLITAKIATIYYKHKPNQTNKPDYYLYETDKWIVFPYEITQMTDEELKTVNPELHTILHK